LALNPQPILTDRIDEYAPVPVDVWYAVECRPASRGGEWAWFKEFGGQGLLGVRLSRGCELPVRGASLLRVYAFARQGLLSYHHPVRFLGDLDAAFPSGSFWTIIWAIYCKKKELFEQMNK
jgi:hypothetical protein